MEGIYLVRIAQSPIVKIGKSLNVEKRIASLQAGFPFDLEVLLAVECNPLYEKELHQICAKYHMRAEWFRLPQKYIDDPESLVRKMSVFSDTDFRVHSSTQTINAYKEVCDHLPEIPDEFHIKDILPGIEITEKRKACNRLVREGILSRSRRYAYAKIS